MKILILGGTGILSTDFTKKTLDEGNEVYLLNRGQHKKFFDDRAELIIGDLRNDSEEKLKKSLATQKYDVVVDFLSFEPAQLEKTLNVLKGTFKQYVVISSSTAYIKKDTDIITEDKNAVGNKNWSYSYNKALCERFIRKQDINYTIIRPYVTFGESRIPFQMIPDGYHYTLLARILNDKPVAVLDNRCVCTLMNTKDFANILYKLLLNPAAYHEAFHITSSSQQTWSEVYSLLCQILGKKEHLAEVSLDDVKKYMPEYYNMLKGDKGTTWRFDNSKVMNAIGGYEFQYDLKAGLQRSVDFYLANPDMQAIDYRWDGEMDFMLKNVAGAKNLKMLKSNNPADKDKDKYGKFMNPLYNSAFHTAWRMKHREELK